MRNVVPAGLLVAVLASGVAFAQQARDWDAVELTIHHVAGDIYYLEGAGGNIGLSVGEDGIVFVLGAGEQFKPPLEHRVGEALMATPAISDGVVYFRGTRTLFAVGKKTSQ